MSPVPSIWTIGLKHRRPDSSKEAGTVVSVGHRACGRGLRTVVLNLQGGLDSLIFNIYIYLQF